ncbi:hypothetical protein [Ornithinimicrobium kibberense]|uniref:hypothetical protein n=1 Tax=Ornithinimicrobium kibberense TaxID=282060 RepID=UPI00361EC5A5
MPPCGGSACCRSTSSSLDSTGSAPSPPGRHTSSTVSPASASRAAKPGTRSAARRRLCSSTGARASSRALRAAWIDMVTPWGRWGSTASACGACSA